jgi:ArsR family transcriptional regulator, arsenate/arsenite/antimonite-responsive transcriptional repressor / arsenate reductase (thioredoxin)
VSDRETPSPPTFLQLAGHPVRWRLLSELARSDHHVRELTELLGHPQNLVSYHLGRLRSAELVSMRSSSADRRSAYYRANLTRCGELLAAAGGALHPALSLASALPEGPGRTAGRPVRVLFLCTGNGTRSQIAEALLVRLSSSEVEARSAGSRPKPLHPNAARAMAERGIDINGRSSKHLSTFARRRFDYVITLCDRVREVCPEFPGHPSRPHWSIPDPALEGESDADTYPAFQRTADELETRIRFFLAALHDPPTTQEVNTNAG